jgi:hypothetical protein
MAEEINEMRVGPVPKPESSLPVLSSAEKGNTNKSRRATESRHENQSDKNAYADHTATGGHGDTGRGLKLRTLKEHRDASDLRNGKIYYLEVSSTIISAQRISVRKSFPVGFAVISGASAPIACSTFPLAGIDFRSPPHHPP